MAEGNGNNGVVAYIEHHGQKVPIGEPEQALAYFQSKIEDPKRCVTEYGVLIYELYRRGLYKVADVHMDKYVSIASDFQKAESYLSLGTLMEEKHDLCKAVEFIFKATDFHAEMDTGRQYYSNNLLGSYLIKLGRYEEAETYCKAAIAIDSIRFEAFINLGFACAGQGRYTEGAQNLLRAARICPDYWRTVRHLMEFAEKHSHELAQASDEVHSFLKLWQREDPVASMLSVIGVKLCRLQNDMDRAERKGNKAIIRRVHRKIKQLVKQAKTLRSETELFKAHACLVQGLSFKIFKNWDKAADSFRQVIEMIPDGLAGWAELVRCLVALGRESDAFDVAKRGEEIGRLKGRRWDLFMYFSEAVDVQRGERFYKDEDWDKLYRQLW